MARFRRVGTNTGGAFDLFPDAQLAVLPGTTHAQVMRRTDAVLALVEPFLDGRP